MKAFGTQTADVLVIGGGCIGMRIAAEAKRRLKSARVVLVEKEANVVLHASGRNSGVVHAGFYYSEDSFKSNFTRQGNLEMHSFLEKHNIPHAKCGKLVVAKDEQDLETFQTLLQRAKCSNVPLEQISATKAIEIEPLVKTFESALWSPSTSSADPKKVGRAMFEECKEEGVEIYTLSMVEGIERNADKTIVRTNRGDIECGYLFNAAGLYADRIAGMCGLGQNYRILPFRGSYLSYKGNLDLKTHIYPVPQLAMPFLGVHITKYFGGGVKIGPTALPLLGREHYKDKWADSLNWQDLFEISGIQTRLFLGNEIFRRHALKELYNLRALKQNMLKGAESMLSFASNDPNDYEFVESGIRAQLVDTRSNSLEMDFVLESNDYSMHVLNAVSPAWTCSIPLARHIVEQSNLS